MIGSTKRRWFTVTLKVAAGTGTCTSNLRLWEGVRLSDSLTRSTERGVAAFGSCGAAAAASGQNVAINSAIVVFRNEVVTFG